MPELFPMKLVQLGNTTEIDHRCRIFACCILQSLPISGSCTDPPMDPFLESLAFAPLFRPDASITVQTGATVEFASAVHWWG